MATNKKADDSKELHVIQVKESLLRVYIVGRTPLIINRLSEKTKRELLYPRGRKTGAERASNLKHDPFAEFTASPHTIKDPNAPTFLAMPAAAPKRAIASAALDIPGAKKAQIGRLTYVLGEYIGIYGLPKMLMSSVRSADMNHTPDIRSRVIVPEWAALVDIAFVTPLIQAPMVINLLSASGLYIGIGDWRTEKGAGNYGQFEILPIEQKSQISHILSVGRDQQLAAMKDPQFYNDESRELFEWWKAEVAARRGAGKSAFAHKANGVEAVEELAG